MQSLANFSSGWTTARFCGAAMCGRPAPAGGPARLAPVAPAPRSEAATSAVTENIRSIPEPDRSVTKSTSAQAQDMDVPLRIGWAAKEHDPENCGTRPLPAALLPQPQLRQPRPGVG